MHTANHDNVFGTLGTVTVPKMCLVAAWYKPLVTVKLVDARIVAHLQTWDGEADLLKACITSATQAMHNLLRSSWG